MSLKLSSDNKVFVKDNFKEVKLQKFSQAEYDKINQQKINQKQVLGFAESKKPIVQNLEPELKANEAEIIFIDDSGIPTDELYQWFLLLSLHIRRNETRKRIMWMFFFCLIFNRNEIALLSAGEIEGDDFYC